VKKILLLGASGSIGQSTLKVIRKHPEKFMLAGVTVNNSIQEMEKICSEFSVKTFGVNSGGYVQINGKKRDICRMDVNSFLTANASYDIVVNALVGSVGFAPTVEALKRSKTVALANKETIVAYGSVIRKYLKKYPSAKIRPVDSEHSALWQLLNSVKKDEVRKAVITASGGVLFRKNIENPSLKDILNHPVWSMGKKVTIDSSTMVNKGLEIIEAHFLFGLPLEKIDVLIHPQSIVHAMVEMNDGTILSHMAEPDMVLPISYALFYPSRQPEVQIKTLSYAGGRTLEFFPVDKKRFPAVALAYRALEKGATFPAVFNASNEAAVNLFIKEKISFHDIVFAIDRCMKNHKRPKIVNEISIRDAENWAKEFTIRSLIK